MRPNVLESKMVIGRKIILALALIVFAFLASCSAKGDPRVIRVGVIVPTSSGYGAANGENTLMGYTMALEDIERAGSLHGKKIELVVQDFKGDDVSDAITAYQSVKMQGINLILGPSHSDNGLAIAPIACEDGTLLLSPAIGISDFSQACDRIFTFLPASEQISIELAKTIAGKGYKRIAVIGSDQAWEFKQAYVIKDTIESINKSLLSEFIIAKNEPGDFLSEATKIEFSHPDAVIFANYGYMHLVAKRLKNLGYTGSFFLAFVDDSRIAPADGAFEGAIAISSVTPSVDFTSQFKSKYGKAPDFPADIAYYTMRILAQAIEDSKSTDPIILASQIKKMGRFEGASGNLTILPDGNTAKTPIFVTVKNNTIVPFSW